MAAHMNGCTQPTVVQTGLDAMVKKMMVQAGLNLALLISPLQGCREGGFQGFQEAPCEILSFEFLART